MQRLSIPTTNHSVIEIPPELSDLRELIYNLWWSWSHPAHRLFHRIDPIRWQRYHNPVELLLNLKPHRWEQLLLDEEFLTQYREVMDDFRRYMDEDADTWFRRHHGDYAGGPMAYFSTEFGWHDCLGIYSGGLGILSGDHCKSASDEGVPFVGVGLMYRRGYFLQTIDADGWQQHYYPDYDVRRLPMRPVAAPDGRERKIEVELRDRRVRCRIWLAQVGRVPVLLLGSDLQSNDPGDRPITSMLYVRGREMRLCQEILLGIGGVRALRSLGIQPAVWHMNEGHSALLALERVRERQERDRIGYEEAFRRARGNVVFTTHTPVPAGNESFESSLVRKYFADWATHAGMRTEDLLALGEAHPESGDDSFNLTAVAIRTSSAANGVSELHGKVANDMWKHLVPDGPKDRPAVGHVTNGVHTPTWIGPEILGLLQRHVGRDVLERLDADDFVRAVDAIPDRELWDAHRTQKGRLVEFTRHRVRAQFARHGRSPDDLRGVDDLLNPDHLTIGFARRFATYKRAALIFRDLARLKDIVSRDDRPVQILFAGKAHPADRPGQDLIREICHTAVSPEFKGRILFLENYNMRIARYLVQGVDVWLNNPRRPQEASGTSGMKVAVNGGLNCSVLDGWWCEGYDPSHGWAIGDERDWHDPERQDQDDADSLYRVLAEEVVPAFYERDDDFPIGWVARMKRAIATLTPRFSTSRMLREYTDGYYLPASRRQGWGSELDEVRLWSP
jgi:starch phosphorylase